MCLIYLILIVHLQYHLGCKILKLVGPKKQDFWPKLTHKETIVFCVYNQGNFVKKCQNHTFNMFNIKNQPNWQYVILDLLLPYLRFTVT